MAEKIEIFKLDIDVDAAIASNSDLADSIQRTKRQLDQLKKSGDTTSRTYVELEASYKNLRKEYNAGQTAIGKLLKLQSEEITTVEEGRNALYVLNKEWAKQQKLYGENSEEAKKLGKQHKILKDRVNELQKGVGDTSYNIGRYSDGFKEALQGTSLFGSEVVQVVGYLKGFVPVLTTVKNEAAAAGKQMIYSARGTEGLSKAQKAATVTTNILTGALKLFKVALIATGIGAILVLLASLVAYFASTQKGIDKVNKVLVPLRVVFETLFGVLQDVGEALSELFTADGIKQFGQAIEDYILKKLEQGQKLLGGIGKILTGDFKAGFNDIKAVGNEVVDEIESGYDKLVKVGKQLGDTIDEAYKRGQRIQELQVDIEEGENRLILLQSEANKNIKEANKIAEDRTKSQKEREAAARRSVQLSEDLLELQNEQLDKKIEQMRLEQQSNDTSRADQKELNELIAQKNENEAAALELQTTQTNKLNTIRQEIASAAKKRSEEEIKALELRLNLYEEATRLQVKTAEESIDRLRTIAQEEIKIEQEKLKRKLISQEEYNLKVLEIQNALKEVEDAAREKDLERMKDFEERRDELMNEIRLKRIEDKQERELAEAELEFEKQVAELEQLQLNEQQKTELLALIEEDRQMLLNEIKERYQQEAIDKFKKFTEEELAIRKQNAAEVKAVADQLAGILKGILGDSLAAQIAGIAIDAAIEAGLVNITAAGAQAKNIAQATATAPPPFNAPFIAAAVGQNAVIQANATKATSKILASAALQGLGAAIGKFEKGGLMEIGGNRHSQGGTKFWGEDGTRFEAEKGELIGVMNRNAAASFMRYNNAYASSRANGNYFASGGIVSRAGQSVTVNGQPIDYDLLATKLADANRQLPRPVVAVEDINTGQKKYTDVIDGANL